MCHGQKNKRELFSDGKSRGPLLARVALNNVHEKTRDDHSYAEAKRAYQVQKLFYSNHAFGQNNRARSII